MKQLLTLIMAIVLTGCWIHRDLLKYESTQSKEFNFEDNQVHIEIVKDHKFKTYPFVFLEKSGKKNIWLVSASFRTPQVELTSISIDLTITEINGKVLFEEKGREVELIVFEGYNASKFDLGSFEKEWHSNRPDTLIASYKINFQVQSLDQFFIDTSYLFFTNEKKSGSFY